MTGLPRAIIKKYGVTKKAWQVYRGEKHSVGKKVMAKRRNSPKRRWFRRARHKRDTRFPLLVGGVAIERAMIEPIFGNESWSGAKDMYDYAGPGEAVQEGLGIIIENFTGYNMKSKAMRWEAPMKTYLMLGAAWAGSKLATKFGVNTAIKKIPLVGKYIKL